MVDLFNPNQMANILPYDGEVNYFGKIMSNEAANHYYQLLFDTIEWQHDEAIMFGKHIYTKRKVAWYGNEPYQYAYSNTTKKALAWTPVLSELKLLTERLTGKNYNSCLLNLYHNGEEGMAYHSDDEKTLGKDASIGSLSFGAARKFLFKHKTTKATVSVMLEPGSLLEMQGTTQTYWMHRLPPSKKIHQPRINLTFRLMVV